MIEKRQQIFLNKPLRIYLIIAICFTLLGGVVDTFEYFTNNLNFLVILNSVFVTLVTGSLFVLYKKKTWTKPVSIVFLYATIFTIIVTNVYFLEIKLDDWRFNFLRDNLLFFIFVTVASLISGTRHLIVLNALYIVYIIALIYLSRDSYIIENSPFYIILLGGFSFAMYWFMKMLKKVLDDNIDLNQKVIENSNLIRAKENELFLEKKAHLNEVIDKKNRELSSQAMMIAKDGETVDKILKSVSEIGKKLDSENKKVIQDLISKITLESRSERWEEFQLRFEKVYQGFFVKLLEKYPKLSKTEQKLAAFIKLGLSSKEIAILTQNTKPSVDVARSRLRKKMNVGKNNFHSFLNNL